MSTNIGYVVNKYTGEACALEDVLIVGSTGEASAYKKDGGLRLSGDSHVVVVGKDGTKEGMYNHPAWRAKMMLVAGRDGLPLSASWGIMSMTREK
jgi:hypothetical protein